MAEKKSKGPKHGIKETHITHHPDGSHTVVHHMAKGEPQGSAHADDGAMMDHMQGALAAAPPTAAPPAEAGAAPGPMAP
jgi:hypothetical protein